MADFEEEAPPPTELELKIRQINEEFGARSKPLHLRQEIWLQQLDNVKEYISAAGIPLMTQRDTSIDTEGQVEAKLGLALLSAKEHARHEVIHANLADLKAQLHAIMLEEQREIQKARLALEPPEE